MKQLRRGDFDTWAELSILLGRLGPDHTPAELERLGIDEASFEAESRSFGARMRDEQARGTAPLARRYAKIAARSVGASVQEVRAALEALAARLDAGPVTVRTEELNTAEIADDTLPFRASEGAPSVRPGSFMPAPLDHAGDGTLITPTTKNEDTLPFARVGAARLPFERFVEWSILKERADGSHASLLTSLGIVDAQAQREALVYWERRLARDALLRARVEALVALKRVPVR